MCSLCSNRCAHCAAINVLSVGQSICSAWINRYAFRSSIHATVQQPKQSISNHFDVILCMQQSGISCALSAMLLCGVLSRIQQCQVLWRWGKDVYRLCQVTLRLTRGAWISLIVVQVCAYTNGRKSRIMSGKIKQVESTNGWQLELATRWQYE